MTLQTQRYAVIVDPYSSGAMLGPAFRAHDLIPVAVMSAPEPPAVYARSWTPEAYDLIFVHGSSVDQLAEQLRSLDPVCVIPGAECGVELAEQLAAMITPDQANVPSLADARRHKARMGEAVAAAGLPSIRHCCSSDIDSVSAWLESEHLSDSALVLKPPKGSGTDGVFKIERGQDWRPTFRALLGQTNKLRQVNDQVLVQEFISGDEYVVDTFSVGGVHIVTNICRYHKVTTRDHIALYDSMEFLAQDHPAYTTLVAYIFGVLDAIGLRFGPAHSEVMLSPDGPRLIETGARMHGGGHPEFCRLATGSSQLDRIVALYTGTHSIAPHFTLLQTVMVVFLSASTSGVIRNIDALASAPQLASHYKSAIHVNSGDHVVKTEDLFTTIGFIVLAHEQSEQVRADYRKIKEWEQMLVIDYPAEPVEEALALP